MNRRDIIIISVLANIAVLAVLFMLAFKTDEGGEMAPVSIAATMEESSIEDEIVRNEPLDEVDLFIEEVTPVHDLALQSEEDAAGFDAESQVKAAAVVQPDQNIVEITVKSGDALEKIARSNGTSVDEIMKLNNLKNDKLRIGQLLKIPVRSAKEVVKKVETPKNTTPVETQYYTIKNGDNPWKIAKQFHLKVDDLLIMNNLDEGTARKLKAGDQIRIR